MSRPRMAPSLTCERNYRLAFNSVSLYTSFRPAGGSFTVEIASNQAKTTESYGGRDTSAWPDGANHPELVRLILSSKKKLFFF